MRKHNCGRWTEFRPLSNVMVSLCHSYANCVLNGQSNTSVVALSTHQAPQVQELTPTKEEQFFNDSGVHGKAVLRLPCQDGKPTGAECAGGASVQTRSDQGQPTEIC